MNPTSHSLSRRGLLVGSAVASAVTVAGVTGAQAAGASPPSVPLVTRDRIATARLPEPARFQADFHERLVGWLAFWSANTPRSWSTPVEVAGHVDAAGDAFTLHAIRYQRDDQLHDGFTAGRVDAAWWATAASLHHHFPSVRPQPGGGLRVTDAPAGFTGSAEQVEFAVAACRELWAAPAGTAASWREHAGRALARAGHRADAATRAGWVAFTRASLRRGLRTESYE
ncbi:hypothetical protein GA0070609_4756 [Micromonospora echinaurantiaca]|uniref:Tat (Twin-arginine translocation) pathway signal sequence n=1 Tax=Micromonospora echinaurantiaca TaxID=47857 RepID=A0A1C5JR54_9ACTN|nr:hypothetical protein [Micromonospora echinaurantiaca]SCG72801.1 hypothetical protein GA0070609_4756 [Micromonospora echinaurantiaca]